MGTVTTMKEASDTSDGHLCADEIMAAFAALSAGDKLKLDGIEGVRRGGTRFSRGELIQETLCLVLLGKRKCPRGITLMAFLAKTMQSIASHDRDQQRLLVPLDAIAPQGESMSATSPVNKAVEDTAADEMRRLARSPETVEEILNLFNDDENAQFVLIAWADGCRGAALREATGLDQADVDYAAKRIRGRMRKLYPNGWTG